MNDENDNKEDKIVSLEQVRSQKERDEKESRPKPPPAINLPATTKYFLGLIIAIHILITIILPQDFLLWCYYHLGFIPARFSGAAPFEPLALLTPITHMFIHGSWIHIGMNAIMMAAFGTGVERWIGPKKMMTIFFISGLMGIALQFILDTNSANPVIGASGGLSGLFAAAIIMLNSQYGSFNKRSMMPMIAIVLVTYLLFGLMGSPDGASVAWAAHIGGFLGGFAAMKLLKII